MSLVGIDVGSSAVKAAAYRADGGVLAQAAEAVPSLHPAPGAAEVSADDVWAALVQVVRRVAASDTVRHPLAPLPEAQRAGLLELAREVNPMALRWGW